MEIADAIGRAADGRRFTTNMERVLFALVANRAVAPLSKLSAAERACEDVPIPGLAAMGEDQAYRAMDLLVEADTQGRVQEAVFFVVAHLLNLEADLLFFDTTSTYFERDTEDEPADADSVEGGDGHQAAGGFRRYGHSKNHRGDLPQIIWLALLLVRVAERGTGHTWANINRQLGRIAQVALGGPAGTVVQTTPLQPEQKAIYQALRVDPPPRITTFDPT